MPILLLVTIAATIVVVDQWSKYYIQAHMAPGMSIPVLDNIFHITYVLNPGAAFGILEHQRDFFIIIALFMLVLVCYFFRASRQPLGLCGWASACWPAAQSAT